MKDINEATPEELERVMQIDDKRSAYLVMRRDRMGGFKSWDDVKRVPSFEEGMVERLQEAGFGIGAGQSERGQPSHARDHDLNQASADELEVTHMIDGERAHRLVDYRAEHGSFDSWDELMEVPGFDSGLVERLQQAGFDLGHSAG